MRLRSSRLYISLMGAGVIAASPVLAEPQLIATASLPTGTDKAPMSEQPLENGTSNRLFGGIGSALAYAGGNLFIALPDRGPNAVEYNAELDNTTSYVPRFHTLKLSLKPNLDTTNGAQKLPFVLEATTEATTLLWSASKLAYGPATAVPSINDAKHNYFTGRSDGFDATKNSLNPDNARFDTEGLRLSHDGQSVFISDEYGPYLYQFDRKTGQRLKSFALPANLAVAHPASNEAAEVKANPSGRYSNKGMEGLAITPDGKTLVGAIQAALFQDGGGSGAYTRLISVDIATGKTRQFAYELLNIGTEAKPKYAGISEILAISDHEYLVLERDGKGLGGESDAGFKHIYRIDLKDAGDVGDLSGASALAGKAVKKTLVLDIVASLTARGIDPATIPAKLEGLTFGPDISFGNATYHTLFIASDNDFLATTKSKSGETVDNPNRLFVFAVSDADLKGQN